MFVLIDFCLIWYFNGVFMWKLFGCVIFIDIVYREFLDDDECFCLVLVMGVCVFL